MVRYYTECLDFEKDELGRYKKIGTNQRGAKIEHDKHNCTNDCYVLCGWKREESIVRIWQCERCGSNNIKSEELADTSKIEDIDFGVDYYEVLGLPENASKREIRDKGIKLITKLDKKVRIEIPDRIKKQVEEELKRKLGRTPTGLEIEKEAEPRIRTDNADVSDKEIIKATRELRFAKEAYETLFNNQKRKKIDDGYLGIKDKVTCYSHQPAVGEVIVGKGKTGIQKNLAKKHSHLYFCKQACLDQCFIMWGENTASSNSGSSGSSFCYVCHQVKNPVKKKRGESKYCCYDCYFKFPTCHQCPKKCWQGSRLKLIEAGKDVRFCSWDCTNAWWEKNKEKLAKQELKKIIDQASNGSLKTAEEIQKAIDLLKIFGNSPLGSAKKKAWDENLAQCLLLYGLLQEKKQIVDLQNKVIREIENYWISKVGSLTNKINNWTIEQVLNSGFMTWKTNLRAKTTRGEIIVEQNRLIRLIDDAVAKQQQQQQQHTPNSSSHQSNSGTSSSNFSSSNTSSTGDSSQDFPSSSQNDSPQSSSARGTNSTPSSSGSNDNSSSSSPGTSPSSTSSSIGSGSSSGSSSFGEGGGGDYYPSSSSSTSTDSSPASPKSPSDKPISNNEKSEKPPSSSNNNDLEDIVKTGQEILENDQTNPEQIQEIVEKLKDYANSEDINKQQSWKDNQETNEKVLVQNITNLISKQPLEKAKETAKQEIKQLQKTNKTFANLNSDWESKLERLKTSQQVANFFQQVVSQTTTQNKIKEIKPATPTDSKPNTKLIALVVGIVVLITGGSLAVMFIFKKKKK